MGKNKIFHKLLWMMVVMVLLGARVAAYDSTSNGPAVAVAQAKGYTGWRSSGGKQYYYLNGSPISSGWHKINGVNCYFLSGGCAASGWLEYNGHRYYLTSYGRPVTGWQKVNGVTCCFNTVGHAITGWYNYNGHRYYLNSYGRPLTGWQTISGARCFFNSSGHAYTGWLSQNGHRYYMNSYGRALTGWQTIANEHYYFHKTYGYAFTGLTYVEGNQYYFNAQGQGKAGKVTIDGITYTLNSYGRVISKVDPVVYRAVVIAQSDYPGTSNDLPGCYNDGTAVYNMLKKGGYTSVTIVRDADPYDMRNAIRTTFANANSNDVSTFYYTGHGYTNSGSLVSSDSYLTAVTMADLASWLNVVPGKIIVMLDSCYSGNAINKSAKEDNDPEQINQMIINTFAGVDAKHVNDKAGEMANGKFHVLTASSKSEVSYEFYKNGMRRSVFTDYLVEGAGYSYPYANKLSSAAADTNKDGVITISEEYTYTRTKVKRDFAGQNVQCYTSGGFRLLKR